MVSEYWEIITGNPWSLIYIYIIYTFWNGAKTTQRETKPPLPSIQFHIKMLNNNYKKGISVSLKGILVFLTGISVNHGHFRFSVILQNLILPSPVRSKSLGSKCIGSKIHRVLKSRTHNTLCIVHYTWQFRALFVCGNIHWTLEVS